MGLKKCLITRLSDYRMSINLVTVSHKYIVLFQAHHFQFQQHGHKTKWRAEVGLGTRLPHKTVGLVGMSDYSVSDYGGFSVL